MPGRFTRHGATGSEVAGDAPFRSTARTHVGKVRSVNEDRLVERPDAGFWAIADGMGGHRAGDVAAEMVANALQGCIEHGPVTAEAVESAVQRVNDALVQNSQERRDQISGSTLVALLARGEHLQCLWVGDSRAYLYRAGQCRKISRDHSVVQELVDVGIVPAADARHHPQAHVLTRAIGVSELLRLDTLGYRIEPGDILLLCSDGLSDLLDQSQMEDCLAGDGIDNKADALLDAALAGGAPDNITLILIEVLASHGER